MRHIRPTDRISIVAKLAGTNKDGDGIAQDFNLSVQELETVMAEAGMERCRSCHYWSHCTDVNDWGTCSTCDGEIDDEDEDSDYHD
jgi:hypothetical protein